MSYTCPGCGEAIQSTGEEELIFETSGEFDIVRYDLVVFTEYSKSSGDNLWKCSNDNCRVVRVMPDE